MKSRTPSLAEILDAHRGVGPGFDALRIALAVSIVAAHSYQIATGAKTAYGHPLWLGVYLQVPMFFTLSGFLVAGSAARLTLKPFLINRALRIYPALVTEVVLSIVLIGLTFTTLSWSQFFADPSFWLYLTNLVGLPHYLLPGVFETNPLNAKINGSLWTVPFELFCYFIMAVLISTRLIHSRTRLLALTAGMIVFAADPGRWYAAVGIDGLQRAGDLGFYVYSRLLNPFSVITLAYFCCGVTAYHYRDRIPYSRLGFALCLAAAAGLSALDKDEITTAWFKLLALPVGVYLTLFLGLTRLPLPRVLKSGDYSYGIYLYGYPIQQAVEALTRTSSGWLNFGLAMPAIFLWSVLSWRFVEKPALALRRHVVRAPEASPVVPVAPAKPPLKKAA